MNGLCRRLTTLHLSRVPARRRWHATQPRARSYANSGSNLDITHSRFLAEASPKTEWKKGAKGGTKSSTKQPAEEDEFEGVTDTRGKLSPTSSHLFKLILPLGHLSHPSNTRKEPEKEPEINSEHAESSESTESNLPSTPPTVILLHPSQPLSHVSRLINASLAPATPSISFRSTSAHGQAFQWSDSTDVGDFIRDAARAAEFTICISYGPPSAQKRLPGYNQEEPRVVLTGKPAVDAGDGIRETLISVSVPTFADRTRFLRRRLNLIEGRLHDMEGLKEKCDEEAHRGAKRMAMGGFGMLIVYWGAVARLTFWDYGWDVMEPITYLSGLSTVILGYLWFLYQGREVSYTSVLARSISARREALYKTRGLDIEYWIELVGERKALRAEIGRIARDYEGDDGDDEDSLEPEPEAEAAGGGVGSTVGNVDVGVRGAEGKDENGRKSRIDKGRKKISEDSPVLPEGEDVDEDEQRGKVEARKANRAGL
ncbi:hypothetical protein B0H34DRAFT_722540 [Crassisporium funariophilum]|nr:hypothetical protein B0H34DRAFT_722540 [Crassisporium funariophilum]